MNEISRKPAHTVAELASARQHQGKLADHHGARGGGGYQCCLVMMMVSLPNPGSVPVARPRQRRNKPAGRSLELHFGVLRAAAEDCPVLACGGDEGMFCAAVDYKENRRCCGAAVWLVCRRSAF